MAPHCLAAGRQQNIVPIRHAPDRRVAPCALAVASDRRGMRPFHQGSLNSRLVILANRNAARDPTLLDLVSGIRQVTAQT